MRTVTGAVAVIWMLAGCAQGNQARTTPATTPATQGPGSDNATPAQGSWQTMSTQLAPSGRKLHVAAWTGKDMLVFGGTDATGALLADGGDYQGGTAIKTWAPLGPNAPDGRTGHTAVWTSDGMVVWGGQIRDYLTGETEATATGGVYDAGGGNWTPTAADGDVPAARYGHTAVSTGTAMIVWGGTGTGQGPFGDGASYSPATDSWTALPGSGAPTPRFGHSAVWGDGKMIIWGGASTTSLESTGGVYDTLAKTWTATSTTGAPSGRKQHTAVWVGGKMAVFGGMTDSGPTDVGGVYDPATDEWTAMSATGAPGPRIDHTAVATSATMIVFGGVGASGVLADGGIYYPGGNNWVAIPAQVRDEQGLHNRVPRADHTAVWTGEQMVLWGGYSTGGAYLQSGEAFTPP